MVDWWIVLENQLQLVVVKDSEYGTRSEERLKF